MFKFFRQVRLDQISKNRIAKYILYAIGEIILVVIGILIALQINNRNTARNNAEIEQQYVNRLISELEEEIERYTSLQNGFERQNDAIIRLLSVWKEKNVVITDTLAFWNDFFAGSGAGPWYREPVIWTQLVQSGELKLIRDQKAVETLFRHYADVKRVSDNFNEYPTETTNEVRKIIATTFAKSDYLLTPGGRQGLPTPEALSVVMEDRDLYRVPFVRVGIIARIHIGQMQQLIESAEGAIEQLKKSLPRDED